MLSLSGSLSANRMPDSMDPLCYQAMSVFLNILLSGRPALAPNNDRSQQEKAAPQWIKAAATDGAA